MDITDFRLGWRWTHESHAAFPPEVLAQLRPLAVEDARALYESGVDNFPVEVSNDEITVSTENEGHARTWLEALPVTPDVRVTIVWDRETGISVPWRIFVQCWADFCYPGSDDAFILFPDDHGSVSYEHYELFRFKEGAI